jgi:hypothetical protein
MAQGKIRLNPHSLVLSLAIAALVSCAPLAAGNVPAQDAVFQERFQAAQEQMQAGDFPVAYTILSTLSGKNRAMRSSTSPWEGRPSRRAGSKRLSWPSSGCS